MQGSHISLSYGSQIVLSDVSWYVNPKEKLGIIGRNGSGKSSLLRIILGEETADSGTIIIPSTYKLGYIPQHTEWTKPCVLEEALLSLENQDPSFQHKAKKILSNLGFSEEDFSKNINTLSGGFQLRLKLAKALICEPDCLVLDEPTNYLDILAIRFLQQFLQKWPKEALIVSHDRAFLDSFCTGILGIHQKQLKKVIGNTDLYLSSLESEQKTKEKTNESIERKKAHMQQFVDKNRAKASKARQAQARIKMIEKLPEIPVLEESVQKNFSFKEKPFYGKLLGKISHLSFQYDNTPLLHDINIEIAPRERIAIIGKNGYGKSTLLKIISQKLLPSKGSVEYQAGVCIGYFGQTNIKTLSHEKTIAEEVWSANPQLTEQEILNICGNMSFKDLETKKQIGVLSYGEQSRVLLAKIMTTPCNLLLLDEPTHHLDVETIDALLDALSRFSGAVILVSHSETMLRDFAADTLLICHKDRQEKFLGEYEDFLKTVGFEEEDPPTQKKEKNIDRHLRAEMIRKRAAATKPFQKKIEALEKEIFALEELQQQEEEHFLKAIEKKESVGEMVKDMGLRKERIEKLFQDLCETEEAYKKIFSSFHID